MPSSAMPGIERKKIYYREWGRGYKIDNIQTPSAEIVKFIGAKHTKDLFYIKHTCFKACWKASEGLLLLASNDYNKNHVEKWLSKQS